MLAVGWTRYACQGNGSWLRGDYASAARLAYWTPAAHVEGYQIRYRVKCLVLELVLGPLVHRFRLDHHPVDDEMKGLALPSNREDVVSGLGGAIPDQEVTIVRHLRFSAFSTAPERAPMIPGVRS